MVAREDRGGGLGGEQGQHLLIRVGEGVPVGLVGKEEAANVRATVAHRRALKSAGGRRGGGGGDALRADVDREVGHAQRPRQFAEVLEQSHAVGLGDQFLSFLHGEAREHEAQRRTRLVDSGDDAILGTGERPRSVHYLA